MGADLHMKHPSLRHFFTVECKGDGKGEARDAKMEVGIHSAFAQILLRYSTHNGRKYGLAFPYHWKRRVLGKLSAPVVELLRLNLFFVPEERLARIEHLTPTLVKKEIAAVQHRTNSE